MYRPTLLGAEGWNVGEQMNWDVEKQAASICLYGTERRISEADRKQGRTGIVYSDKCHRDNPSACRTIRTQIVCTSRFPSTGWMFIRAKSVTYTRRELGGYKSLQNLKLASLPNMSPSQFSSLGCYEENACLVVVWTYRVAQKAITELPINHIKSY